MSIPIEIPMAHRLEWSHSPRLVGAEFSADGQTVFVHMHTPMLDLFAVMVGYAWWIALAVFVVGMAVSWWWLLRVNARPQQGGLPYCRKCNYELSGQVAWDETERVWAMAPSENGGGGGRCPECGAELAKVRARRGVATWKRRLWPSGLALVACAVFFMAIGLRLYGALIVNAGNSSRLLSVELAEWVEREGIRWLRPFVVSGDRIVAIDAASGREIREVLRTREISFTRARLSPDGKTMLRLGRGGGPDQVTLRMHAMEPGGRDGAIEVPISVFPPMDLHSPLVGMIEGGSRVLMCGQAGQEDVLVELDLGSGAIRMLHRAPAFEPRMHANWSANQWDDPSTLVRSSSFRESHRTKEMLIQVFDFIDGSVVPRVDWKQTTQIGVRHAVWAGARATILPDGERALVPTTMHGAAMLELDLAKGGVGRVLQSRGSMWHSIASEGSIAAIAESVGRYRLRIYHTEPTELIATAPYSTELVNPVPHLSRDGRRLAAIGFIGTGQYSPPGGYRHVLLLYDLAAVHELIAERHAESGDDASNSG